MKKIVALMMVVVMMFSIASVVSAADYDVDITKVEGATEFKPAGYTTKILQLGNYGHKFNLGKIDLTKYSKVIISYGADGGATFDGKDFVAIASGALQNEDETATDAKIFAKGVLEPSSTGWVGGQREVEATISVADFTAGSDVYLTMFMDRGSDGRADGIAIDEITFVGGNPGSETIPGSGEGSTDDKNPATSDAAVVAIVAVAAFALAGVVVSKKVKA